MSSNSIRVFAPASVSNVGPGFDIMGFAVKFPGDEIIIRKRNDRKLRITKITGVKTKLPVNISQNTAGVAIKAMLKELQVNVGLDIEIHKKMEVGSGIGSSAASAVGAVFAANKLLSLKQSKNQLLNFALAGESIASGAIHADNVAPALFGGFILIRSYNPIDIIRIPTPINLYCSIVFPQIQIKTIEARRILPAEVNLKTACNQAGNAAGLIAGLITSDFNLIARSLVDHIAEPRRALLIPFYDQIRKAAFEAGAINCNVTGSGPSMFAFSDSQNKAIKIARSMEASVKQTNTKCVSYVSKINNIGPKVLD